MSADPASRPGRLGVGVIGAGRVGAVLGSALRGAGHPVVGVSAVSQESRERAAMLLPGVPVLEVPEVVRRAELVLLAVPDDALAPLVRGLAETGAWQAGQIVAHTSGRFGTAVLAPARAAGVIPLALHPAMTFTGTSLDLARLVGCAFAVTAPGPVLPIGQALVVEIGGEPVVVGEEQRPLYHAGLAHGANHLVVLVAQAAQALRAAGVDEPGHVLRPLLEAALDGALRAEDAAGDGGPGAISALTGPVRRGDAGTVADHVAVLTALGATTGAVDVPAGYGALSRAATARALGAGLVRPEAARDVLDALAGIKSAPTALHGEDHGSPPPGDPGRDGPGQDGGTPPQEDA
ncbi:Rossmann-like and DUF2520 domain-containing protein [Cellulomonas dongxiuzhuiae]|uniref:DUF2520 domain-containing protein n=1 Tax=Cellulomonas dongxiuzhuiae TaxID=2819979 RepID=A0ABX8GL50_9CELL|nr:DUF2520 domain-containing protein [Cellulomonas dongxiuzhuiae]MBO3089952.1 DUF2520 domain-containing protein [Cellulomonas dongxiuzhuiae]MBO3095721.1 DUF2520 domain-containing protein [Cellulomonas dongxiuzhuiae]QWC16668.1 DUF2520 domain-containing protein [Cellulomonas dongxiuzhuiae]